MNLNKNRLIAKRWAKSLIKLDIAAEIREVLSVFESSNELYNAFLNPSVSRFEKDEITDAVFKDLSDKTRNFLKLLLEKKRFAIFKLIAEEYFKLLDKTNNTLNVTVTSAIELESSFREKIENIIQAKLNKNINTYYEVDSNIIAGLIFKIEDNVLDSSLRKKLENCKKELIKK